ncbi:MAG: insulinase family protein [Bdellovibrionales bacterium]|nr:insulinase family protein [Bdellovibrionales bacterium]
MKRALIFLAALVTAVGCASGGRKPSGGSAAFQIRPYETQVLPNGLTILWIPDQSLPYVSLQMMVRTGSAQDPAGKEGVSGMTAALLERGTARRSAPQISEDLEQIGSGFGAEVQPDYTVAASSALSFNKDNMLTLFQEILLKPTFPQAELERQRKNSLAGLQKLADRPEDFSEYLMPRYLYGAHPYGHSAAGTPTSLKGMTRADVQNYYKRHYAPSNSVLAVVGQYDNAWKQKVIEAFQGWNTKEVDKGEVPDFPAWSGTEVLLVDRPDLNQAQIQIGFKGVPRNVPEYLDIRAALKILGESFGSRLFDEIRVKRGLTYGIYSWFDPRLKPGPMGIYTFTRAEKIGETVTETLNTYRQFVKNGVTDEEVAVVKALMRGQFPRTFETPETLARQLLILNRYGIGPEYLQNYLAAVDAISKSSVNAAIKKYFDPDNLRILVYAPRKASEESLKSVGKVQVKDYKEFLR